MSAFMRKFVILEEQPDYYKKVQGLTPKGHMNIEVRDGRGKLTINVDNLKVDPDEGKLYKACLVGENNKDYVDVDLGVIVLNDKGKGSIEWKFDPASVGGTSLSIEKFNNILVKEVNMNDESKGMVVPLSGYIYKKDGSLVKLMKKQNEIEPPKKQEISEQVTEKVQPEEMKIEEPETDNEKAPEEVNSKDDLQQSEVEVEAVKNQEDTYVAFVEKAHVEETNIEENSNEAVDEQEVKSEEIQEEIQEDFNLYETKIEEPKVEDLFFDDIIPLDLGMNEIQQGNLAAEYDKQEEREMQELEELLGTPRLAEEQEPQKIQEVQEVKEVQEVEEVEEAQEEIEEQIDDIDTAWIDIKSAEKAELNNIPQINYQNDDFIKVGDDFESYFMQEEGLDNSNIDQNLQVTYNYGDYIDNTYGSKINKIDPYMDTAKNYSMQVANYTMDILKFFNKVEPFRENLRDCTWWRIEQNNDDIDRGFLPFYNYLVNVYYPYPLTSRTTTCQSMIEKYGHYIFGTVKKQEEVKYYVYGVPGRFTIADHPYNGATGFNTWLRDKDSPVDLGYWLIYIDALSGKIVNPVNPTIPTR